LLEITGRAAYIWGDGLDHDDSYPFTKNTGILVKGNIDHHDDTRSYATMLNFYNHMTFTERDGVRIITPRTANFPEKYHWEVMQRAIRAIKQCAVMNEGEIALTIDLDALGRFPVHPSFVYDYGFTAQEVIQVVAELRQKIARLDFGGVRKDLPEFERVDVDLTKMPRVEGYVLEHLLTEADVIRFSKEAINLMGSYALMTYAGILEAFC
jgi:hypothetical protein